MSTISPKQIYDIVSEKVIGQEEAKKLVCNSFFMHFSSYIHGLMEGKMIPRSNALLMGPTGSGKTFIIREAAKAAQSLLELPIFPIMEIDCTEISSRGWEGDNLSDKLRQFHRACDKKGDIFDTGVVFLDEFDKLCKPAIGRGGTDHNRNTQYNLLKMTEGMQMEGEADTGNLLFIFAGNFSEIRAKRAEDAKPKQAMGFTSGSDNKRPYVDYHTELDKAGMVTQLVGRTPHVGQLYELKQKELKQILEEMLIPEVASIWNFLGEDISLTNRQKNKMVKDCFQRRTGARGLRADLSKALEDQIFNMTLKL